MKLKIDKTIVSFAKLTDDSNERKYWLSKTPGERLEALEFMRQVMYDYNPVTDRVQRTIEITQLQ